MLGITHVIFAFAVGYTLKLPAKIAAAAGLLVDADMIFFLTGPSYPLVHRGVLHTPLALALIMILAYFATRRKDVSFAIAAGFISHLLLDTLNPTGIFWLYPIPMNLSLGLVSYTDIPTNSAIIIFSLALVLVSNPRIFARLRQMNLPRPRSKGYKLRL